MLEMKIGEIKIMALKCVEAMDYDDDSCEGCLFYDRKNCNWPYSDKYLGDCRKVYRLDKKDVIFVSIDPNEVIRERIERQIDRFNDNGFVRMASKEGDCTICLNADFLKDYLFTLLEVLPEPKEELEEETEC